MQTTGDMVRNYSANSVHKLASQLSQNSSILGGANNRDSQMDVNQPGRLGNFVSLASGPSDTKGGADRLVQPSFTLVNKNPQNLSQMKAPPAISERPAAEESDGILDQKEIFGAQTDSNRFNGDHRILDKDYVPSPNSIVGKFFKSA